MFNSIKVKNSRHRIQNLPYRSNTFVIKIIPNKKKMGKLEIEEFMTSTKRKVVEKRKRRKRRNEREKRKATCLRKWDFSRLDRSRRLAASDKAGTWPLLPGKLSLASLPTQHDIACTSFHFFPSGPSFSWHSRFARLEIRTAPRSCSK